MLNENNLLDYHYFSLNISTRADGSKDIIISASKNPDDAIYKRDIRISADELKYINFEKNNFLDYAMSAFLFNKSKQNDNTK